MFGQKIEGKIEALFELERKGICASAVCILLLGLMFSASMTATSVRASDPAFALSAVPGEVSYSIGDSASVEVSLVYSGLLTNQTIVFDLWNGTHFDSELGNTTAVNGTTARTYTQTFSMPANATAEGGSIVYTLKAIENTSKIIVASDDFTVLTADIAYHMSVGVAWTDSDHNNIINVGEPIQFTMYLNYANLPSASAVAVFVSVDGATKVRFYNTTLSAGSGTVSSVYSIALDSNGVHTIAMTAYNATSDEIGSVICSAIVGAVEVPSDASITGWITQNYILVLVVLAVVVVVMVGAILARKPKVTVIDNRSRRRYGRKRNQPQY